MNNPGWNPSPVWHMEITNPFVSTSNDDTAFALRYFLRYLHTELQRITFSKESKVSPTKQIILLLVL